MSTARAIQVSVTHAGVGVIAGAIIEALMPAYRASASNAELVFEAAVQVAVNGLLISQVGTALTSDDPTFGMPFSLGLFEAQRGLMQRLDLLASKVHEQVLQVVPKTRAAAPKAE